MDHKVLEYKLRQLPKTAEGRDEAYELVTTLLPKMQDLREHLNLYGLGKAGSKEYAIDTIVSHWVISEYMLLCDAIMQYERPDSSNV